MYCSRFCFPDRRKYLQQTILNLFLLKNVFILINYLKSGTPTGWSWPFPMRGSFRLVYRSA